jgi:hypothetical protein
MDMGPTANERARRSASTIRRWTLSKVFLGTLGGVMNKNLGILRHFCPRILSVDSSA